jgi:hypothetical protein
MFYDIKPIIALFEGLQPGDAPVPTAKKTRHEAPRISTNSRRKKVCAEDITGGEYK